MSKEKWEEEFEDEFVYTGDWENEWIDFAKHELEAIIKKYKLFHNKIKIKARKGAILIERIN